MNIKYIATGIMLFFSGICLAFALKTIGNGQTHREIPTQVYVDMGLDAQTSPSYFDDAEQDYHLSRRCESKGGVFKRMTDLDLDGKWIEFACIKNGKLIDY